MIRDRAWRGMRGVVACLLVWMAVPSTSVAHEGVARSESGMVWLVETSSDARADDRTLRGELMTSWVVEVLEDGGALMVASTSEESCALDFTLGEATLMLGRSTTALVEGQDGDVSVYRLELEALELSGPTLGWQLNGSASCLQSVEGVVLFIAEASAYVSEDPANYWEKLQRREADNK